MIADILSILDLRECQVFDLDAHLIASGPLCVNTARQCWHVDSLWCLMSETYRVDVYDNLVMVYVP